MERSDCYNLAECSERYKTVFRMTATKDALLARMADHVLAHGLRDATLRPLARAAGTSDRMLIYHFGSKEALVAAILDHLALRLTSMLDAAPPAPATLADAVLAMMRSPPARPYVAVWLEVVAGAARGEPGFRDTAARILSHFHRWLIPRLPAGTSSPEAAAARLLVMVEGTLLVEAAGDTGRELTRAAESPV